MCHWLHFFLLLLPVSTVSMPLHLSWAQRLRHDQGLRPPESAPVFTNFDLTQSYFSNVQVNPTD